MTTASIAAMAESLAQIADQGPRDAVGQHNPGDDPVFFGMGDPGNQPDIAVDRFDIDARCECVANDERFGQGRVFVFLSHHPSQLVGAV